MFREVAEAMPGQAAAPDHPVIERVPFMDLSVASEVGHDATVRERAFDFRLHGIEVEVIAHGLLQAIETPPLGRADGHGIGMA